MLDTTGLSRTGLSTAGQDLSKTFRTTNISSVSGRTTQMTKGAADNLAKQMANLASGTDDAAAASRLVIKSQKLLGPALSTALANSADDLARGVNSQSRCQHCAPWRHN